MTRLKTSLEQWLVLQTVIETGSFAKAGEFLHKSQSSISYAIKGLQEALGMPLLEIVGNKAQLTNTGKILLDEANKLIIMQNQLELHANMLKAGRKAQVKLMVDAIFPKQILFKSLEKCHEKYPDITVHLTEILKTEDIKQIKAEKYDLYLIYLPESESHMGNFLLNIDFIAVAHENHPLCQLHGPIRLAELKSYPIVTINDYKDEWQQKEHFISNWNFTTIEAAIDAVYHQLGYAWLPKHKICSFLEQGTFKQLELEKNTTRKTPLYLVYADKNGIYDQTIQDYISILQQCLKAIS